MIPHLMILRPSFILPKRRAILIEITPEELKTKLDRGEKMVLIDVREPDEHAICRINEAKPIPIKNLPSYIDKLNPKDFIVFYCHHGIRSAQAALWFERNGFKNVKSLAGGIDAWAETIDPSMERY